LNEKYRFRVFENRVLRGIFGPKRDELTSGWKKLCNGSIIICTSQSVIESTWMRWEGRGEKCTQNFCWAA
jgi:hypothetical protein